MATLVWALFGAWFAASVVGQFERPWIRRLRRFDGIGLIPTWTFFAPNPGTTDHHLVYRDLVSEAGHAGARDQVCVGDWTEVPLVTTRRWFHFVWNPGRRWSKVVGDCVNALVVDRSAAERAGVPRARAVEGIPVSVPYLALLNLVVHRVGSSVEPGAARSGGQVLRQFAVVERRSGSGAVGVVLCSAAHRID